VGFSVLMPTANEIDRQFRQTIVPALRPAVFDRHVLALDVAGLGEAAPERSQHVGPLGRRPGIDEPDHRHRLLRARPRGAKPQQRRAVP